MHITHSYQWHTQVPGMRHHFMELLILVLCLFIENEFYIWFSFPVILGSGSLYHSNFVIFNKVLKPPWTSPQLAHLWTGDNACCEHWWEHMRKSSVQVVFTQEMLNQCYWCKFLENNDYWYFQLYFIKYL